MAVLRFNPSSGDQLDYNGYGEIQFSMSVQEAEKVLDQQHLSPWSDSSNGESCKYVSFEAYPEVYFMVEENIITRAETKREMDLPNILNITIGESLESIRSRYPEAEVSGHKYDENGHYIVIKSANSAHAFVFRRIGWTGHRNKGRYRALCALRRRLSLS